MTNWVCDVAVWLLFPHRCPATGRSKWRRGWSSSASSLTTRSSCCALFALSRPSVVSPWGTVATWPLLSWQCCRASWSTPLTSWSTCSLTSSTATSRARTTPSCCCAGENHAGPDEKSILTLLPSGERGRGHVCCFAAYSRERRNNPLYLPYIPTDKKAQSYTLNNGHAHSISLNLWVYYTSFGI